MESTDQAGTGRPAWLLNLGHGLFAAIGHYHLVHLLQDAACQAVPRSPPYCQHVVVWQDHVLPVMDLALRLQGRGTAPDRLLADNVSLLGITAFQPRPDQAPEYGALLLAEPARRIRVSDEQAAELPSEWAAWRHLCHSCFKHPQHGAVPILNLPAIFSAPESGNP